MTLSRSGFRKKDVTPRWMRSLVVPLFATLAACSGTLIIGEGEQMSDADSGVSGGSIGPETSVDGPSGGSGGLSGVGGGSDSDAGTGGIAAAGGTSGTGGAGGDGDANASEAGESSAGSGGIPPPGPRPCGAALCSQPAECCYLSATCFDPSTEADACPAPPADGGEGTPCGADSHCAPGEYCRNSNNFSCVGAGRCTARDLAICQSVTAANETCACDGITRPEVVSCQLGIRALSAFPSACGEPQWLGGRDFFYCGNDPSWCPAGTTCCALTGYCFDPAQPDLCVVPPSWALLPCTQSKDCPMTLSFCQGLSCGEAGGCKRAADCKGAYQPVCGCDGLTYMNDDCAAEMGVATSHEGACDDAGL